MKTYYGIALADIHSGSVFSLMLPEFEYIFEEGEIDSLSFEQNRIQKKLYGWFTKGIEYFKKLFGIKKFDFGILLGDMTEGVNRKEAGIDTWTTNYKIQIQHASEVINMIPVKTWFAVSGSGYHIGGQNVNTDDIVYEKAGVKPINRSPDVLKFSVGDVMFLARHFSSGSGVGYSASGLQKAIRNVKIKREVYGDIDVVCLAHTHEFVYAELHNMLGIKHPCWKFPDGFGRRRNFSHTPSIGLVAYKIRGNKVKFYDKTYKIPTLKCASSI